MEIFQLQKIITIFLSPLGLALLLMLLGLLIRQRALLLLAVCWLWLWSLPWTATQLVALIEAGHAPIEAEQLPRADAILLLGGALDHDAPGWQPEPNLTEAGDRVLYAAKLYSLGLAPKVIYSGGGTDAWGNSEAKAGSRLLLRLNVPASAQAWEGQSRTTRENVIYSLPILEQLKAQRVLLVTSSSHMARSLRNFREGAATKGLEIEFIQAPCDPIKLTEYQNPVLRWLPSTIALDVNRRMFKEILGSAHAALTSD
ncbi:MAG: YdcF family protein [Pseudomonadota bacterium]